MTALHLIELPVRLRAFTEWALERRFLRVPPGDGRGRPREPDLGYPLHAALAGLFGERAPRPFVLLEPGSGRLSPPSAGFRNQVPLLAYSVTDGERLSALAGFASQEYRELFACDELRTRVVPNALPCGVRLGFDLRACPVRRRKPELPFTTNVGNEERKSVSFSGGGNEVDAFQLASVRAEQVGQQLPGRSEVYAEWLKERFATMPDRPSSLALVEGSVRVRSYRSTRLLRRPRSASGRSTAWLTRPAVWFSGQVEVVSGSGVPELLARGIGRHSGFGFGMMLLRPA